MKHLNDHSHDLKLSDPFYQDHEVICSVCEQELSSSAESYVCTKTNCVFILHKSCFELPQKFEHKFHPNHFFTLLSQPPTSNDAYLCDACDGSIKAFGYQCEECNYKIHVKCALLPESVDCKAHDQHTNLDLCYSLISTYKEEGTLIVSCGVCDGGVKESNWSYVCKERDFVTHVNCVTSAKAVKGDQQGSPCLFGLMSRCFCLPVS